MTQVMTDWTSEAADQLMTVLRLQELALMPLRVHVFEQMDAQGEEAWRVQLVLPRPHGETWDRELVFHTRRAAVRAWDELADAAGRSRPGYTVALVTTDDAAVEDVAEDESPEAGEDPGRDE